MRVKAEKVPLLKMLMRLINNVSTLITKLIFLNTRQFLLHALTNFVMFRWLKAATEQNRFAV